METVSIKVYICKNEWGKSFILFEIEPNGIKIEAESMESFRIIAELLEIPEEGKFKALANLKNEIIPERITTNDLVTIISILIDHYEESENPRSDILEDLCPRLNIIIDNSKHFFPCYELFLDRTYVAYSQQMLEMTIDLINLEGAPGFEKISKTTIVNQAGFLPISLTQRDISSIVEIMLATNTMPSETELFCPN